MGTGGGALVKALRAYELCRTRVTTFRPVRGRTGGVRGGLYGGNLFVGCMDENPNLKTGGRHLGLGLTCETPPRTAV